MPVSVAVAKISEIAPGMRASWLNMILWLDFLIDIYIISLFSGMCSDSPRRDPRNAIGVGDDRKYGEDAIAIAFIVLEERDRHFGDRLKSKREQCL